MTTKIQAPPLRTVEILYGIDIALARCECRKQYEIAAARWLGLSCRWFRLELAADRLRKASQRYWRVYTKKGLTQ